jgi:hypothetical protein
MDMFDGHVRAHQSNRVSFLGMGEKLQPAPARRSLLVTELARTAEIRIIRKGMRGTRTFAADEDTTLASGCVVGVAPGQRSAVFAAKYMSYAWPSVHCIVILSERDATGAATGRK